MKNILKKVGILLLLVISFYYTNETTKVVKDMDKIMIEIKEEYTKYNVELNDTIFNKNYMIVGTNGYKVNINKSFDSMHKYGTYNSDLYRYDVLKKEISNDKYINGGVKGIYFIFKIDKKSNVDKLINILNKSKINGNIFASYSYLESNSKTIMNLLNDDFIVGNISNNGDYTIFNSITKNIGKQKYGFCYLEEENSEILKDCSSDLNYTIIPSLVISKYPFIELKKNIKDGMIIAFDTNDKLLSELELIINYVNSMDLKIYNLIDLIDM